MNTITRWKAAAVPRVANYIELTKPRILLMILLTVVVAMVVAGGGDSLWTVLHACLGTALVAASASVMNQWLERSRDAQMLRTCRRPLPSGRVATSEAAWMGWVLLIAGAVYLGALVNFPTMWVGLATWFLYVAVYTPLKPRSWVNTLVGAVPGALPVWMGWTAAGGSLLDREAWVLLAVLIAWQLPHFMAIAAMYREQYEAAGYRMVTVTDRSGWGAGLHAVGGALALVILSPLAIVPNNGPRMVLCAMAGAVSLWMLAAAIRFVRQRDLRAARKMLHVSLFHLPLMMLLIVLASWF
ncbi:MAG: protoheme IX farnesyltransferase [Planctomycetota bacterium]|nr:MAG: protoheme IX farnesyltransferase [Planctomycetota bacterium]